MHSVREFYQGIENTLKQSRLIGMPTMRVLVLLAVFAVAAAENSYLITAPRTMWPGQPLELRVHILDKRVTSPVTLLARVTNRAGNSTLAHSTAAFTPDQPGVMHLQIPDKVLESWMDYKLHVNGSGGLTFHNSTRIQAKRKARSIFVQTDKGVYKPGQNVLFRVFSTDHNLKPYTGAFDITIKDPKSNVIMQWNDRTGDGRVISDKLALSDQPVLGTWAIRVVAGTQEQVATFDVAEYVLPKFEVKVELPNFALLDDDTVTGTVGARYTYGKGVKGTVTIRARMDPFYRWNFDNKVKIQPFILQTFPIDETAEFSLSRAELERISSGNPQHTRLQWKKLVVEANVTETLTGITLAGTSSPMSFNSQRSQLVYPATSPTTFKPGLAFTTFAKLQQHDGSVYAPENRDVEVKKTYTWEKENDDVRGDDYRISSTTRFTREDDPEVVRADDKGVVLLSFNIPAEAQDLTIELTYNETEDKQASLRQYIRRMTSPSDTYLQLRLLHQGPVTAGSTAHFELKSTKPMGEVKYQVLARGRVVSSGDIDQADDAQHLSTPFSVPVTSEMAPQAKLLVYEVREDGEVVNDATAFKVEGAFANQVALSLSRERAEPGEAVEVQVSADPGSYVALVAVDQSSLLLKSANDITPDRVLSELADYDPAGASYCRHCWWLPPVSGRDASTVFKNAGLAFLTDATVFASGGRRHRGRGGRPMYAYQPMAARLPMEMEVEDGNSGPPGASPVLKEPTRVRTSFPETWIWTSMNLTESGSTTMTSQVPDTITSWVASAFALHPQAGLGVVDSPTTLEVFRPFFVTLTLPYSVVRGEQVIIQATVFNYLQQDLQTRVTLTGSHDFAAAVKNRRTGSLGHRRNHTVSYTVTVKAGEGETVKFAITPKTVGSLALRVKAQAPLAADALERRLIVEPEGVEQEYTESFMISLQGGDTFSETVPIAFPPTLVPDSSKISITALGDVMGVSASNLGRLLRMPWGCGEQNMLNFAPNIFVLKYLEVTGQLTDQLRGTAINYMTQGYQRQLTYQRRDGSFSAFGDSDSSGSTWLTAFVMKSFQQAKPYIFIDDHVLDRAGTWLAKYQTEEGSFWEPGTVFNTAMQGGTGSNDTLTAYILISLLGREVKDQSQRLAIRRATEYLETQVTHVQDMYGLSIMQHALQLGGSGAAPAVRQRLAAAAIRHGGTEHWERPQERAPPVDDYWRPRHSASKAINIEMTAYNLLSLAHGARVRAGAPVMRWLTQQRNARGGFISTQDTVIALQALGEFAALVYTDAGDVTVDITSHPETHQFHISSDNSLVLAKFMPSSVPTSVRVAARGEGMALVQVNVKYNVMDVPLPPAFDVTAEIEAESKQELKVKVCVRYEEGGYSGMAVVEHGLPSGFSLFKSSLAGVPGLKKTEVKDRTAVLYFDSFGREPVCYTATMYRSGMVAKPKPSPIKVYDYYSPDQQTTIYYVSRLLRRTRFCDICKDCKDICN